ncbi:peptidylprolyl isomerase [Qipengyuania sp. MTN3-11]|uniref:peptidylprolyl isomerase n=1 Tax=Qipengyuania sp. MTN3-11 TaxID=3056557 RepID=UPI0036F3AA10
MKRTLWASLAIAALALPLAAQEAAPAPSPGEIVAAADPGDWIGIAADDLLVMDLAAGRDGQARRVVIQLMPEPFSQGWIENIRTLARTRWYDGISVNRVQDNYVTQWGDPNYDNPEAEGEAKPLPGGLMVVPQTEYTDLRTAGEATWFKWADGPYANHHGFYSGWPIGWRADAKWPVHCYGMVGVGRGMSPDTGSGAELYTVIGHAPRHLDRNIALVGRVIEGMEHLSSLPRGSGALGFYTPEEADKRTPIRSVRVASDLAEAEQPRFEYLATDSETFARYAEARANRRDPFFIVPAGGADICNIPVPVRRVGEAG